MRPTRSQTPRAVPARRRPFVGPVCGSRAGAPLILMISAACHELLADGRRFSATFGGGLFNHLPMALVALDRLGADETRLRAFFTSYATHLNPKSDAEIELTETMRGQGAADVVPQLSAGVASQAFHGLIRVAY